MSSGFHKGTGKLGGIGVDAYGRAIRSSVGLNPTAQGIAQQNAMRELIRVQNRDAKMRRDSEATHNESPVRINNYASSSSRSNSSSTYDANIGAFIQWCCVVYTVSYFWPQIYPVIHHLTWGKV